MMGAFSKIKNLKSKINYELVNFRLLDDPIFPLTQIDFGTSISDGMVYNKICKLAVYDDAIYKNFRRYKSYFSILEHVPKNVGRDYLHMLVVSDKTLGTYKNSKIQNSFGNPIKYYFRRTGFTSPTLLRYLKVLGEIQEIFGSMDGKSVVEIGVGYGGQAGTIMQNTHVSHYYLFDLEEVNLLATKFLHQLNIFTGFSCLDGRNPSSIMSDLVISNYAFSELNKEVQNTYLNNVLLNAKRGYITWNDLGYTHLDSLSIDEITEKIPNSRIIDEKPLTAKNNKVIIWGDE
jgi:hypothetical protein